MRVVINGSTGLTFPDSTTLTTAPTGASTDLNGIGTYRIGATRVTSNSAAGTTSAGTAIYEPVLRTSGGNSDAQLYPAISYISYVGVWYTGSAFGTGSWRSMNTTTWGASEQPYKNCVMWVRYA